jgi:hypothetical protein
MVLQILAVRYLLTKELEIYLDFRCILISKRLNPGCLQNIIDIIPKKQHVISESQC